MGLAGAYIDLCLDEEVSITLKAKISHSLDELLICFTEESAVNVFQSLKVSNYSLEAANKHLSLLKVLWTVDVEGSSDSTYTTMSTVSLL